MNNRKVLFLCTGNSCCSQVAEAIIKARRTRQEKYLLEIAERFHLPLAQIPILSHEIGGLAMLAELGEQIYGVEKVAI